MIPEDEKRRRVLDAVTGRKPYKKDRVSVPLVCMAFVLFFLSGLLLTGVVSASPVPAIDVGCGATWIQWNWATPLDENISIYVDGALQENGTSLGFFVLSNLNSNERHRIDLLNTSVGGDSGSNVCKTHMSFAQLFLIIGFIIGCVVLGLLVPYMPIVGFIPATGLLMYLIDNNFEGWLILFVAFLWLVCLLYGFERLESKFGGAWRGIKRK